MTQDNDVNDEAEEDGAEEEEDEEDEEEDNDEDKDEDITHAISIADLHETKINEGDRERELEGEREAPSK